MSGYVDPPIAEICPILKAQILQIMAVTYVNFMKGVEPPFGLEEGMEAALATWETPWDNDPEPRTIESAIEAVNQDLEYWGEE